MPSALIIFAITFAVLSILAFASGILALKRGRLPGGMGGLFVGLLLLSLAGLFATITLATQGYRALLHEQVAATVQIEPAGPQIFTAVFRFPGGRESTYRLAGDELYVDAHILKWKPLANAFGLYTAYELQRVAGRYVRLEDERSKPRTVFSLSGEKAVDMFNLRRRYWFLKPLVDAQYGSATFIAADLSAKVEVRVSATGLLIRKVEEKSR